MDFDQEVDARRRANALKLQELGLPGAVKDLKAEIAAGKATVTQTRRREPRVEKDPEPLEIRRSTRERSKVTYNEEDAFREMLPPAARGPKRARTEPLTEEEIAALREQSRQNRREGGGGMRGPRDSGKGVRRQGGKLYDSSAGVTCHWCRQKTIDIKATCTRTDCGNGRALPKSFCRGCLKNRHGEDVAVAMESGSWVCPCCRGSCGAGCRTCCNCGPCRLKVGLPATGQLASVAERNGYDNVHDYLVGRETGESQEELTKRKMEMLGHTWRRSQMMQQQGGKAADGKAAEEDEEEDAEEEYQEDAGDDDIPNGHGARQKQQRKMGSGTAATEKEEVEEEEEEEKIDSDKENVAVGAKQQDVEDEEMHEAALQLLAVQQAGQSRSRGRGAGRKAGARKAKNEPQEPALAGHEAQKRRRAGAARGGRGSGRGRGKRAPLQEVAAERDVLEEVRQPEIPGDATAPAEQPDEEAEGALEQASADEVALETAAGPGVVEPQEDNEVSAGWEKSRTASAVGKGAAAADAHLEGELAEGDEAEKGRQEGEEQEDGAGEPGDGFGPAPTKRNAKKAKAGSKRRSRSSAGAAVKKMREEEKAGGVRKARGAAK